MVVGVGVVCFIVLDTANGLDVGSEQWVCGLYFECMIINIYVLNCDDIFRGVGFW